MQDLIRVCELQSFNWPEGINRLNLKLKFQWPFIHWSHIVSQCLKMKLVS